MRTLIVAVAAGIAALAGGCVVAVGNRGFDERGAAAAREVRAPEMDALLASTRELTLGMTKHDALSVFPAELASLVATSRENGRVLEIYRIAAYEKRSGASFTRYLYFVDGELAEVAGDRIRWQTDPERQRAWFGREIPPPAQAPAPGSPA